MKRRILLIALVLPALPAYGLRAQEDVFRPCTTVTANAALHFCNLVAEGVEATLPRVAIALSGGNPVAGSASTLGLRMGRTPRFGVSARFTGAPLDLPPIGRLTDGRDISATLFGLNLDLLAGVFEGWSLFPTVGGFASVDLLGSLGAVTLPDSRGFDDAWLTSWALGLRLGLLRESFTVPGLTLSGVYRRLGRIEFGDSGLGSTDSYFDVEAPGLLSLRGVVGKRFLSLGTSAGFGYDRIGSDVAFSIRNPEATLPARFDLRARDARTSRVTLFGALNYTTLVISIAGEVGWQFGGDAVSAPLPAGQTSRVEDGALYGNLTVRLIL